MTSTLVKCPNCGVALRVREDVPAYFTCPKCIEVIENPSKPPVPLNVTRNVNPLDYSAHEDAVHTGSLGVAVVFLIAIGSALVMVPASWSSSHGGLLDSMLVLLSLTVGVVVYVLLARPTWPWEDNNVPPTFAPRPAVPLQPPIAGKVQQLDYASPRDKRATRDKNYLMATLTVFLGILLGIGTCAGGLFLLAANSGNIRYAYVAVITAAIMIAGGIGARVSRRPGLGAFRPGVIIGLTLGMLVLGPCAGCYLNGIRF